MKKFVMLITTFALCLTISGCGNSKCPSVDDDGKNDEMVVNLKDVNEEVSMTGVQIMALGNYLFNYAHKTAWGENFSYVPNKQDIEIEYNGENVLVSEIDGYEHAREHFSKDYDKDISFRGIISKDGKYYQLVGDRGSDVSHMGDVLEVVSVVKDKIVFKAYYLYCDDQDIVTCENKEIKEEEFIIIKEDNRWVIDSFVLAD